MLREPPASIEHQVAFRAAPQVPTGMPSFSWWSEPAFKSQQAAPPSGASQAQVSRNHNRMSLVTVVDWSPGNPVVILGVRIVARSVSVQAMHCAGGG